MSGTRAGREAFAADVPNSTFCSDGDLLRAAFMRPPDVRAFIELLESRGLRHLVCEHPADLVVIGVNGGLHRACDWLECGYADVEGGEIMWGRLAGSESLSLSVPEGWRGPLKLRYFEPEEIEARLRFAGQENAVDVFEDRETGKKWYAGRTSPPEPVIPHRHTPTLGERIARLFRKG